MSHSTAEFVSPRIAVLAVSDTRTLDNDTSGALLFENFFEAGDGLADRVLLRDDIWQLRAQVCRWLADGVLICCLPGSTGACRTAGDGILASQLDSRYRPCNFVQHLRGADGKRCG